MYTPGTGMQIAPSTRLSVIAEQEYSSFRGNDLGSSLPLMEVRLFSPPDRVSV